MGTYTWVDYLIFAIFGLSILMGLVRGLIREIISLATLIAAFFVAITFSGSLGERLARSEAARSVVNSFASSLGGENVADAVALVTLGLSFFALFLVTMVVGEIINKIVSRVTCLPGLGFADHLLGIGFGAVRGFLITVVMLFLFQLTLIPQQEAWTQSQLLPIFQSSVQWLSRVVQPGLEMVKDKMSAALQHTTNRTAG